jgi:hypothetical protein
LRRTYFPLTNNASQVIISPPVKHLTSQCPPNYPHQKPWPQSDPADTAQQTDDLEQKKLVYLYLMNYAKTQPELVILAVNTFVKVSEKPGKG